MQTLITVLSRYLLKQQQVCNRTEQIPGINMSMSGYVLFFGPPTLRDKIIFEIAYKIFDNFLFKMPFATCVCKLSTVFCNTCILNNVYACMYVSFSICDEHTRNFYSSPPKHLQEFTQNSSLCAECIIFNLLNFLNFFQ